MVVRGNAEVTRGNSNLTLTHILKLLIGKNNDADIGTFSVIVGSPWGTFSKQSTNSMRAGMGEIVKAYLDDHYTAPEGRKEFIEYKENGTFGYRSSKLKNIVEMEFYDSKSHYGLQASDLCCYIYQRHLCVTDAHPKVQKLQDKLWSIFADLRIRGRVRIWP